MRFLFDILRLGHNFAKLRKNHLELLAQALHRSRKKLVSAASEWKIFSEENYISKRLPISDYPQYIEIQEALGTYRRSRFERAFRKLKRIVLKQRNVLVDKFGPMLRNDLKELTVQTLEPDRIPFDKETIV
jgi:hypothetical protein